MPTLATPVPTTDHNYGVDYPVRVEAPMPRDLFDRLTDHDHAPICRYEEATGLAEFVAMPGVSHEGRAGLIARLFAHIEFTMLDAGLGPAFFHGLATRLLSDDGAFEPDASLFVNPSHAIVAGELEGFLDTRDGHPVPDLVVEVDRSVRSSRKLLPYFRMGVREAWIWSKTDGTSIWVPDATSRDAILPADASVVLPGVALDDLDGLLADGFGKERLELSRRIARQVAELWGR